MLIKAIPDVNEETFKCHVHILQEGEHFLSVLYDRHCPIEQLVSYLHSGMICSPEGILYIHIFGKCTIYFYHAQEELFRAKFMDASGYDNESLLYSYHGERFILIAHYQPANLNDSLFYNYFISGYVDCISIDVISYELNNFLKDLLFNAHKLVRPYKNSCLIGNTTKSWI